jgi:hypothetical protein
VKNLLSSRLLSKNIKIKIYRSMIKMYRSMIKIYRIMIKIYRIMIFPVVLYGCQTWSLTLREGHRLRVFKNRVVRKILDLRGTR